MHDELNAGGIAITARSLWTFLTKGVLPGRKVAKAARVMVSEEGGIRSKRIEGVSAPMNRSSEVPRRQNRHRGHVGTLMKAE